MSVVRTKISKFGMREITIGDHIATEDIERAGCGPDSPDYIVGDFPNQQLNQQLNQQSHEITVCRIIPD